jgi:type VI secretion system VasD/TssJ family lipoprotein
LTLVLCLGLIACGGATSAAKPADAPQNAASPELVQWTRQPGGLTLDLTADARLNLFEGFTHNTMLCIYQMSDPVLFTELAASLGGLQQLLVCAPLDPSVVDVQRRFVSPGETTHLVLDRPAGARFVGLVAGYNDPQPGYTTALHSFPVSQHRAGWWPWSKAYGPGSLRLTIMLKPNSLQSTESKHE